MHSSGYIYLKVNCSINHRIKILREGYTKKLIKYKKLKDAYCRSATKVDPGILMRQMLFKGKRQP